MSNLSMEQLLELSDEELMNYEIPELTKEPEVETDKEEDEVSAEEDASVSTGSEVAESEESEAVEDETVELEKPIVENLPESDKLDKQEIDKNSEISKEEQSDTINYSEFYSKVMAPFKANGRTIQLDSAEDVVTMLQKGANYTKKMQEIAPYRNLLMMLQKNEIVDEDKLSFLIDLDKKNPEAIKKLVKDAGMDPLEMDVTVEPAYKEGNHRVTVQEAAFSTTLDEIKSQPNGQQTLLAINSWDIASKNEVFASPDILYAIHEQKLSGVYDQVADEVEKLRSLGKIPETMSFIEAYKVAGTALVQKRMAKQNAAPIKIETKTQTPKQTVINDKRVKAANPTKISTKLAEDVVNPLSMSDDEFMKKYNGRL